MKKRFLLFIFIILLFPVVVFAKEYRFETEIYINNNSSDINDMVVLHPGDVIDFTNYSNSHRAYLAINHNQRFTERQAKFIFKKILEGIRAMHNANICHRDLMAENILLDGNYNPKISGFYFSCINANNLQDMQGTISYTAPEILLNQPYNGIQSDIFSLGQLLFVLVTGRLGFNNANQNDNFYRLIINPQNHAQYWEFFNNLNLSQSFKNLFVSMVAQNPGQRPTIDQILNDEWMQEINNLTDNQRIALENQVLQEFQNREVLLQQHPAMIINNHDDLNNDR